MRDFDLLIIRRKEECKEFHEKNNNTNKSLNEKQYIVDIDWFLHWKCFVTNDLTEKYLPNNEKRISSNNKIGILSPGPIYNEKIIDHQKNVKKNLVNVFKILSRMKIIFLLMKLFGNFFSKTTVEVLRFNIKIKFPHLNPKFFLQ